MASRLLDESLGVAGWHDSNRFSLAQCVSGYETQAMEMDMRDCFDIATEFAFASAVPIASRS